MVSNLKVEVLDPVVSKGFSVEQDFKALADLAGTTAGKHKERGFV
jgi:hypothetical protein